MSSLSLEQREQRKLTRLIIEGRVDVLDRNTGRELGILVNIHAEGFMLFGNANLKDGSVYQVLVRPWEPIDLPPIELSVHCAWAQGAQGEASRLAGFRIIDASESVLQMIQQLPYKENP